MKPVRIAAAGLLGAAGAVGLYFALRSPSGLLWDARRAVGEIARDHGAQAEYRADLKLARNRIESLERELAGEVRARKQAERAVVDAESVARKARAVSTERISELNVASQQLDATMADPDADPPAVLEACLEMGSKAKLALNAQRTENVALQQQATANLELANSYRTELSTVRALRDQESARFQIATDRVKQLRRPRFRIGPGVSVGITLRNGQVSPSFAAGISIVFSR